MSCSCSPGHEAFFDEELARKDAARYRRRGLDRTARRIVSYLVERGIEGRTVLEIGGGLGGIQLELLRAGAERTINLELSSGYEPYARELIEEAGFEARVERALANVVETPQQPADAVVLHRVVCCYPDAERLVEAAAAHARGVLVLSYPPRHALSRLFVCAENLWLRVRGIDFRSFVHPPETIHAAASAGGLRRVFEHRGLVWHVAGFERT